MAPEVELLCLHSISLIGFFTTAFGATTLTAQRGSTG